MTDDWVPFIETHGGVQFRFRNARFNEFRIPDIAHALSNICRFGGHCRSFYSVAQHSVHVSYLVPPEFALHGLMHDAAEAYIGDMVNPLKFMLRQTTPEWDQLEMNIERGIADTFRLRVLTGAEQLSIHYADLVALATERRDLMPATGVPWPVLEGIEPDNFPLVALNPAEARAGFLSRWAELSGTRR